jgi:hypothetical protein
MNRSLNRPRAPFALAAAVLAAVLAAASCDQSPIFNSISNETEKADALIDGSPSRIVKVGSALFVSNGRLWTKQDTASGTGTWSKAAIQPGGGGMRRVRDLATTDGSTLYALTIKDDDELNSNKTTAEVWKSVDSGGSWTELPLAGDVSEYTVDSLYVADGKLFAGAHATDTAVQYDTVYALLHYDGSSLTPLLSGTVFADGGMFVGVAWDGSYYYFASTEYGIFKTTDLSTTPTLVSGTEKKTLTGIAAVGQGATKAVVAVCGYPGGDDTLIQLEGESVFTVDDQDYVFTGAIAEYDADADGIPDYLLLGIKYSTIYGYREIALDASGNLVDSTPSFSKPDEDSSVADYDQYAAALGVEPVRYLYQSVEGTRSILYASTTVQGLWSSTDKGDWNLVSE